MFSLRQRALLNPGRHNGHAIDGSGYIKRRWLCRPKDIVFGTIRRQHNGYGSCSRFIILG